MTRRLFMAVLIAAGSLAACFPPTALAGTGILATKHNLSASGPGAIKALTETRVCVFCHTPHNAMPSTPLWNKKIEAKNYLPYGSTTMNARPSQPTGPSRLCLSCHDGTIALGEVLEPGVGFAMNVTGGIPSTLSSYLGTSLSDDHPVSFSYFDSLPNPQLSPLLPSELEFYGNGTVHCSTCHDAHDNTNKKFLKVDSSFSRLCTLCHLQDGWTFADHNTSPRLWNGQEPNPWRRTGANTDFNWTTVAQNGCENCHASHTAGGPQWLMNYQMEEDNCYPCHSGNVAVKNVQADFQKLSRHPVEMTTAGVTPNQHKDGESPLTLSRHVECVDCHNPHAVNGSRTALPPNVSGALQMVSGVTINGAGITPPEYSLHQYEICFKCHGDLASGFPVVPRVINTVNTRLEFTVSNPSMHPVAGTGRNFDVPSLPSAYNPAMTAASIIYCTDCHDSDESQAVGGAGPRGPHGSRYRPLLRQRYETADNTPESADNYALCYECHNRTSILADDSFKKNAAGVTLSRGGHSGHLGPAVNATCSACHDPHGIVDDGLSGSHVRLMNFDTRIASPLTGNTVPFFTGSGARSGNCTLVCHGVAHDPACTDTTRTVCVKSQYL
jgi:predicted CXXCH cytochrome family protein